MDVLKNLRSRTEMKMSAATRPTNTAAVHSMALMTRSPKRRFMRSQRRLVLRQARAQGVEHLLRIGARLLRVGRPRGLDRGHRLAPRVDLLGRELRHLVPRRAGELGAAGGFEVGPWARDLLGPFGGAVVVAPLLLRRLHR